MKNILSALALLAGVANAAPKYSPLPSRNSPPSGYGSGTPTATLKNGTVVGTHTDTYNQDYFLGVPFAQPPVGELRFRNPQSLNSTYNSTLQATSYAPECVGYGGDDIGYEVSEDCLYLNVIRPSGYENESLPVGVWIHGGGFAMGGTPDARYNLSFIVENSVRIGKPIIGVSIAYRLSAWGFLASQEVVGSGNTNIALRDQRLALHWLQENIGGFGGDADKVTIWGESAGAASVGLQLTAYNGRDDGLFRGGIMESGNPVLYSSFRDVEQYQPIYDGIVANASCQNATDTLDCLRQVPFATLNAMFNTSTLESAFSDPIVDGDIVARWGSIQLAEGDFAKVPILSGTNTDEGLSFGPQGVQNESDFAAYITSNTTQAFIAESFVPGILEAYPNVCSDWIPPPAELPCNFTYPLPTGGAMYRRSSAYFGDVVMTANRRGAVETWAANGVPAYSYRFNTRPAGLPYTAGVPHFQEVAFVFDNVNGLGYNAAHGSVNPFANESSLYTDLARHMSSSWASFIADLDPNYVQGRKAGTPDWPVYSDGAQNIVFDGNVTELAYPEPDTYRESGIRWILDHNIAYHR
ncbi:hypothetical protein LTR08_008762 [Meristemomyces frigidus]|nr:hypothetical protein LTR08_008762 [Meristemomyces frigidus]